MMLLAVISQMAADAGVNPMLNFGLAGAVLTWFMVVFYRLFSLLEKFLTSLKDDGDATRAETRKFGHHLRALEIAMLFEASTRPGCPPVIKDYAERKIERSDSDMNTRE